MKKLWLCILISFMILSGCTQTQDSEPIITDDLKLLENKVFNITGQSISQADEKTIIEFGMSFVNLFSGAVAEQVKVSFDNYISNEHLLKFTDRLLDLTQKEVLQGKNTGLYGLANQFKQSYLSYMKDNICFLELKYEYQGSGGTCKMLITADNKSLKLVDLYFGMKEGIDTYATGNSTEREMNNPNLWNNAEWVRSVFEKLERYETTLNS